MAKRSIKRNSRAVALLACIALAIALLPATASAEGGPEAGMPLATSTPDRAATIVASGNCDYDLTWTLDDSGTLTIKGEGAMDGYTAETAPWKDSADSIKALVVGSGVIFISKPAFDGCRALKDAYLPPRLSHIEISSNPTLHYACGDGVYYSLSSDETTLTISKMGEGTGKMDDYAYEFDYQAPWYRARESITKLDIGDGVTSIGSYAFYECEKLRYSRDFSQLIVIPDSVASIGDNAFYGCSRIVAVGIGDSSTKTPSRVTSVGNYAFAFGGAEPHEISIDTYAEHTYAGQPITFGINWSDDADVIWLWKKISAEAQPSGGGTVTLAGATAAGDDLIYFSGTSATLTAAPSEGYVFANWTDESGKVVEDEDGKAVGATYKFKVNADRTLTANFKLPLTITANDQACEYNGHKQGPGDKAYDDAAEIAKVVTVEGLQGEDALSSVTVDGQGADVGEYALVPSAVQIGMGGALTEKYAITYVPGKLAIAPAPLTVATGSATKVYDGKALTNSEASITGLVNGETATVEATGSRTEVGSSANTCSIKWGTAKAGNYAVTERLGTLTVEAAPAKKGTLTFDLAGGTLDGKTGKITIEANVGDTIKLPGAPTRKGYAFKYWKGSEYAAGAEYKVEGDHAFTAEWVAVHTVTFDANGHGKAPDAQNVEHGKKAKKPANPTADGYTFGGWYKDKACKQAYDFSKPVTSDVTLYAKWTKKSSSGSGTSPKTGDPLAGAFAIALALAAASALALAASRRRSRG